MITKALLDLLFNIINSLLSLLPALDAPWLNDVKDGINTVADTVSAADAFIPVKTVFIVLSAVVAIPVFKFLFFIINWIIRRIADVIPYWQGAPFPLRYQYLTFSRCSSCSSLKVYFLQLPFCLLLELLLLQM